MVVTRMLRSMGLLVSIAVLLAACSAGPSPAGGSQPQSTDGQSQAPASSSDAKQLKETLILLADPSESVGSSPYSSLPLELGYFAEEGLDVFIQPVSGTQLAIQSMSQNLGVFVQSSMASLYPATVQDPNLVIPAVLEGFNRIVVPEDSAIKGPQDLVGKTVGVTSLSSATYLYGQAVMLNAGLDPNSVTWLPVSFGAQAAEAMESGDIVAYSGYDTVNALLGQLLEKPMRVVESDLNLAPAMGGFIVPREVMKSDPKVIEGILRAVWKSVVFAKANPEAAVRAHWAQNPEQRPSPDKEQKAMADAVEVLNMRVDAFWPKDPNGLFGWAPADKIQETADLLADYGFMKEPVDVSKAVDLSLIEASNDFDRDAITAQAKAAGN